MHAYYKVGFVAIFGLAIVAGVAFAANIFDITYPIAELGGCENQSSCKDYCDKSENADACQAFAESKGLVKKTEKPHVDDQKTGPGGCKTDAECRNYCDDPAHTEECIDFAEREGHMSKEQAARAREFLKKRGARPEGPGGCKNEKECRAYCDGDEHFDECMDFAEKEGFMSKEEIERARKFRNKTGPGGCKGEACKNYCDEPGHEEECLAFAEKEGLIPKEEVERARKFLNASKDGGPGGCRGRQCENYCNDPAHRDECFEFAKKQGLIDEKELEHIERGRKLEEKVKEAGGPGGCKDEKSCMEYCKDPAHVEECLGFASAHGGMDRDTAERMLKQFVDDGERFGPRPVGRPGEFRPRQGDIEERFRKFEDFEKMEKEFRGEGGPPPDGERPGVPYRTGPGGCKTPDECMKYCFEHRDECGLKEPPREGEQRVGPPAGEFRPEGRPFQEGEFKPQGQPFRDGEFQPRGNENQVPRSDQLEMKKYFNEQRPPDSSRQPERPNVVPFPQIREGEQRPAEQQFREQYQQEYQKQYEQQFQGQQPQQPQESAQQMAPPPPPPPPSEPPPTSQSTVVRVFANVLFAPVRVIEALLNL